MSTVEGVMEIVPVHRPDFDAAVTVSNFAHYPSASNIRKARALIPYFRIRPKDWKAGKGAFMSNPADEHLRRYGHITARLENKVILWGGLHHDSPIIWIYNINKRKWSSREAVGDVPPRLSGSCGAIVGRKLYIFAGLTREQYSNEIYCLDPENFVWTKIESKSMKPTPRDKFGCWVVDKKIVYFGGYGSPPSPRDHGRGGKFIFNDDLYGWNNDLIYFDTSDNTWNPLPHSDSDTPTPRAAHSCTKVGKNKGYLFGGRSRNERLNDLYSLSFPTNTWCRIVTSGCSPQGRSWHSFISIDDAYIFLHGGFNTVGETLSDSWLFNVKLKSWMEVDRDANPKKRMWHTSCLGLDCKEVLIFCGCEYFPGVFAGMRIILISPLSLKRLALETICKNPKLCGSGNDLPNQFKAYIESVLVTD